MGIIYMSPTLQSYFPLSWVERKCIFSEGFSISPSFSFFLSHSLLLLGIIGCSLGESFSQRKNVRGSDILKEFPSQLSVSTLNVPKYPPLRLGGFHCTLPKAESISKRKSPKTSLYSKRKRKRRGAFMYQFLRNYWSASFGTKC